MVNYNFLRSAKVICNYLNSVQVTREQGIFSVNSDVKMYASTRLQKHFKIAMCILYGKFKNKTLIYKNNLKI